MRLPDLSRVEEVIAAEEARAAAALSARRRPDQYRGLDSFRRAAEAILLGAFSRLDIDGAELERVHRGHTAELERFADEARRTTASAAAGAVHRLDSLVAAQRLALEADPLTLGGPDSELLLAADFIRSWPTSRTLEDWRHEPGVNWAKYRVQHAQDSLRHRASEKVSFYFFWQNPRNETVFADILVRLTVNGHCACRANGRGVAAWAIGGAVSQARTIARLTIWGLWSDPAPLFPVDDVTLASLTATGGFLGDDQSTSISEAPAVATHGFVLPANAPILVEASLAVEYEVDDGRVDADFASHALFSVGCPYAVVTLPAVMTATA